MEDFEKGCCPATTGAPLHSVPAMHRSRTARSPLRGLLATNPRVWRLEHHVIYYDPTPQTDITPTSAFSTKVAQLSLLTVNRCDSGAVATLHFRRTMSSTLWGLVIERVASDGGLREGLLSRHYGRASTLPSSYASLAQRSLCASWPTRYKSPWLATRTPV